MLSAARAYLSRVKLSTRYIPFRIYLADIRWSGDWSIVGPELQVRSAYGSATRPLGRRKPDRLARELLIEILTAKLEALERARAER